MLFLCHNMSCNFLFRLSQHPLVEKHRKFSTDTILATNPIVLIVLIVSSIRHNFELDGKYYVELLVPKKGHWKIKKYFDSSHFSPWKIEMSPSRSHICT